MELILMILAIILVAFVFFLVHNYSHKKLIITAVCIFSLVFLWFQYRHFYKVDDITFTVWKTKSGCYITPYRYWGFTLPKSNYINISNLGSLVIFIENDTTLLIFLNRNYDGVEKLNCNIEKFNYQEFLPTGYQKSSDGTIMFKKIENYFEEDSLLQAKNGKLY